MALENVTFANSALSKLMVTVYGKTNNVKTSAGAKQVVWKIGQFSRGGYR